jgi:hypothetical protein
MEILQNLKLKEMVVALLNEMDVSVSDEDIEAILDKVVNMVLRLQLYLYSLQL